MATGAPPATTPFLALCRCLVQKPGPQFPGPDGHTGKRTLFTPSSLSSSRLAFNRTCQQQGRVIKHSISEQILLVSDPTKASPPPSKCKILQCPVSSSHRLNSSQPMNSLLDHLQNLRASLRRWACGWERGLWGSAEQLRFPTTAPVPAHLQSQAFPLLWLGQQLLLPSVRPSGQTARLHWEAGGGQTRHRTAKRGQAQRAPFPETAVVTAPAP